MKWCLVLVCLSVVLVTSRGAAVPEDKRSEAPEQKQEGGERLKRSGDILGFIGSKIHSKISAFASASGGLSSLSSSSKHQEYGPPTDQAKSFDFWTFKKALLGTLLQAVKAIKGGLIAIKGQLIKAKGHILTTKGRIISAKGEAISNFGKHVASTALNLDKAKQPPPHHSAPSHPSAPSAPSASYASGPSGSTGFGPSYTSGTAYGGPPPPAISSGYGVPTAPSGLYGSPFKVSARGSSGNGGQSSGTSSSLPPGTHAGLLVIKPIPSAQSSGGGGRASSYTSSGLHDFFGAPSRPVAAFVAAPSPFGPAVASSRSDQSSFITPHSDYSIVPSFSASYTL